MPSRFVSIVLLWCFCFIDPVYAAAPTPHPPPVMLATVYAPGVDVSAYWVSEKLDGVRGRWDGHHLWTRSGLAIDPPRWFTAHWPAVPMDGELWIGRGRFDAISALVRMSGADARRWRTVRFMVFDLPADGGRFEMRVQHMRTLLRDTGVAWLQPIAQVRVRDADTLDAWLKAVVAAGGEGLVLHHRDARYRIGRSDELLKYKPYDDAEARVIGHTAGRGKYTGMLGALIVERADGLRFRLGSGFSDPQRVHAPPIGSYVTYRYNGLTDHGVPRFARFMRIRRDMPPPDPN